MRNRLLFALVAGLLVLAGCSDDSSSDDSDTGDGTSDDSGDGSTDDDSSDDGDSDSGTTDDNTTDGGTGDDSGDDGSTGTDDVLPSDALEIDPVGVTEQIDTMIEEASADGDVTGDEIGEILEVSGTPEAQATCEGALLAELGVTDPTDPDQLVEAATRMTEDQRIALSVCLGGG